MATFRQRYIEVSNLKRSANSVQWIEQAYDLLYELQAHHYALQSDDRLVLSNLYTLLEHHESAYQTLASVQLTDKKMMLKLGSLQQKAKSHKNTFALPDRRTLRKKPSQPQLTASDFYIKTHTNTNSEVRCQKEVMVFGHIVEPHRLEVTIEAEPHNLMLDAVVKELLWLSDCKQQLIDFYNKEHIGEQVDDAWFDSLEVLSVRINLNHSGMHAQIACTDNAVPDHILDIEIDQRNIIDMLYDG